MSRILLFTPMYNCENQIIRVLGQVTSNIGKYIDEWIIINNRSTDNGEQVVKDYIDEHKLPTKIRLFRNYENYGLGGSHKVAFQYALANGFDYVIVFHGDDQGRISDFIPLLESKEYEKYDCCLGARFMKNSELIGYNKLRICGNYVFNFLFSIVVHKSVKDLGSGLNMYKVSTLKSQYFMKYPDTLYFNDLMILASCYYKHEMLFYPISWREEDQVSNNKLWSFSCSLLKMLVKYVINKKKYLEQDMRSRFIDKYQAKLVCENEEERECEY